MGSRFGRRPEDHQLMSSDIDITIPLPRLLSDVLHCAKTVERRISLHVSECYPPHRVPTAKSDLVEIGQLDALIAQIRGVFDEISVSFHGAISALGRRRNASININTLPDEILCPIFVEGAQSNVLAIADTCTRWRDVCIDHHEIWEDVTLPRTFDRAQRLLSMAQIGGHPLGVTIAGRSEDNIRKLFLPTTGLVQRLSVSSWWGADWFNGSFPRLRELAVEANEASPDPFILPAHLGSAGNLTSVSFRRCRMPYLVDCYRNLTTLRIVYRWYESDKERSGTLGKVADGSLTKVLQACPDLEDLALCWAPMSLGQEAIFQPQNAGTHLLPLLQLRRLRLAMFVHQVSALLSHISPSAALTDVDLTVIPLELHRTDIDARELDRHALFSFPLEQCLPLLSTLTTLTVRNVNVRGDPPELHLAPPAPTPSPAFSITFDGPIEERSPQSLATAFDNLFAASAWLQHPHYALDGVHTLRLALMEDMPPFGDRPLVLLVRVLRRLRTLALAVDNPFVAVELLSRLERVRVREQPLHVLPGLEQVTLVSCPLRHAKIMDPIVNAVKRLGVKTLRLERCPVGRATSKADLSCVIANGGLEAVWIEE